MPIAHTWQHNLGRTTYLTEFKNLNRELIAPNKEIKEYKDHLAVGYMFARDFEKAM